MSTADRSLPPDGPPLSTPFPAPPVPVPSQAEQDREHLRLLAIFHFVLAGVAALFSLLPVFHLLVGFGLLASAGTAPAEALPGVLVGWIFVGVAGLMMTLGFGYAACLLIAGRSLAERRRHTFCLVVAGLSCLFMPIGTALGIFTILVLVRPSVRALFPASPGFTAPLVPPGPPSIT